MKICKSADDDLKHRQPRTPSPLADDIIQRLCPAGGGGGSMTRKRRLGWFA